ncbi:hypothetical protein H0H81_009053 [Sphagnurus paluster]|uniref:Uncharacterized protein n=1 Tax=Sphagnurus paluster TaxID=117069 RepID=A0A9P7K5S9_9AGAR|nr:hypothetical protein H0H81_009053 [Sphagnurus paluster]
MDLPPSYDDIYDTGNPPTYPPISTQPGQLGTTTSSSLQSSSNNSGFPENESRTSESLPVESLANLSIAASDEGNITTPLKVPIGVHCTPKSLVAIQEVKGHLSLLHAFAELRSQVDTYSAEYAVPLMPEDKDRRWAWFVGHAVQR